MFSEVFQKVVRTHYTHVGGSIRHFQRSRIRNGSYPVVRRCYSTEPLIGVLYLNVSMQDLLRLDKFEGCFYRRRWVSVTQTSAARPLKAQLYVVKPQYNHLASGQPWSPQQFAQAELKAFIAEFLP